jgi:hypothetical protein
MLLILFSLISMSLSQQIVGGGINTTFISVTPTSTVSPSFSSRRVINTGNLNQITIYNSSSSSLTPTYTPTPSSTVSSMLSDSNTQTPSLTPTVLEIVTHTGTSTGTVTTTGTVTSTVTSNETSIGTSSGTVSVTNTVTVTRSPVPGNLGNNINANNPMNPLGISSNNIAAIVVVCIGVFITGFIIFYYKNNMFPKNSNSPVFSAIPQHNIQTQTVPIQQNPLSSSIQLEQQPSQNTNTNTINNTITNTNTKKWTSSTDGVDTWYISPEGESTWVLPDGVVLDKV